MLTIMTHDPNGVDTWLQDTAIIVATVVDLPIIWTECFNFHYLGLLGVLGFQYSKRIDATA